MKGDFSRLTFRKDKHYSRVLMQQGRVQLDADSIEGQEIGQYRAETQAADVIGPSGTPRDAPGFEITSAGGTVQIGAGHYYVDGILVENEAGVPLDGQPHLAGAPVTPQPGGAIAGLIYLDVWEELVTPYDDPSIKEIALGGADTALRSRVAWQVKLLPLPSVNLSSAERATLRGLASAWRSAQAALAGAAAADRPRLRRRLREARRALSKAAGDLGLACGAPYPARSSLPRLSTGQLEAATQAVGGAPAGSDPLCVLAPTSGYTGLGNQLYRVEIHTGGDESQATFKWSGENASIQAQVTNVSGSVLSVDTLGRDTKLGFGRDDWVELSGDNTRRAAAPTAGGLYQIDAVDPTDRTITLKIAPTAAELAALGAELRIRRWDQEGDAATVGGGIPVTGDWQALEEGIEVKLGAGTYRPGDYWLIPARTANGVGRIEWPTQVVAGVEQPLPQDAHGVEHHYADLALVVREGNQFTVVGDCRNLFPPLTGLRADEVAVDNDQCDLPGVETVQDALDALCQTSHGCVELVIPPRPDWQALFAQIADGDDGNVCMQLGEYTVSAPVVIRGSGHLKLTGAGQGTRILAPGHERALVFVGWKSVTVRDLYVETRSARRANDVNGALSFQDCHSVTVEHVTVKNAPNAVRASSCITVRNTRKVSDGSSARIRDNDLWVGYLQVGILLVDVERPTIENNTLRAVRRPSRLTWERLVENKVFRARIAHHLLGRVDTGGGAPIADEVLEAESRFLSVDEMATRVRNLGNEDRNTLIATIAAADGTPAEDVVRTVLEIGSEDMIGALFHTLPVGLLGDLSRTVINVERRGPRNIPLAPGSADSVLAPGSTVAAPAPGGTDSTPAPGGTDSTPAPGAVSGAPVARFVDVERNALLTVNDHTLAFRAPPPVANEMTLLFRENIVDTSRIESAVDLHRAMRGLVDRAILGDVNLAVGSRLRRYLDRLKANNPAVGSRGIVVAGRVAKDVRILNNTLSGFMQGIRVGLSHRDNGRGEYDYVRRLQIVGNTIDVTLSIVAERERYGIFAGNCRSVTIEDNRVHVGRFTGAKRLHIEGIRLYGYYGPMVKVCQNHLSNFDIGVYYNFLDDLDSLPPHLWLIADNFSEGTSGSGTVEVDARRRAGEREESRLLRKIAKRRQVRIEGNAP